MTTHSQVGTQLAGADGRVIEVTKCALVVLSGPRRGAEKLIETDVFRVGKSPDNELVLDDETVSRNHCEIVREARGYLLRDLGSTNGTVLDGAEIKEAYLKPGAVITDSDGNLYVTGRFTGTVDFDPGLDVFELSAGPLDTSTAAMVAKYLPDGSLDWARQAGGTSDDRSYGVSTFADGSCVVTGDFSGTATFGTTTLTAAWGFDVFVARYNADGDF